MFPRREVGHPPDRTGALFCPFFSNTTPILQHSVGGHREEGHNPTPATAPASRNRDASPRAVVIDASKRQQPLPSTSAFSHTPPAPTAAPTTISAATPSSFVKFPGGGGSMDEGDGTFGGDGASPSSQCLQQRAAALLRRPQSTSWWSFSNEEERQLLLLQQRRSTATPQRQTSTVSANSAAASFDERRAHHAGVSRSRSMLCRQSHPAAASNTFVDLRNR